MTGMEPNGQAINNELDVYTNTSWTGIATHLLRRNTTVPLPSLNNGNFYSILVGTSQRIPDANVSGHRSCESQKNSENIKVCACVNNMFPCRIALTKNKNLYLHIDTIKFFRTYFPDDFFVDEKQKQNCEDNNTNIPVADMTSAGTLPSISQKSIVRARPVFAFSIPDIQDQTDSQLDPERVAKLKCPSTLAQYLASLTSTDVARYKTISGQRLRVQCAGESKWITLPELEMRILMCLHPSHGHHHENDDYNNTGDTCIPSGSSKTNGSGGGKQRGKRRTNAQNKKTLLGLIKRGIQKQKKVKNNQKRAKKVVERKLRPFSSRTLALSDLLNRECQICFGTMNVLNFPPPQRHTFKAYRNIYGIDLRTNIGVFRRPCHELVKELGWVCPCYPQTHTMCDADFTTWIASCIADDKYPIPCPFTSCPYEITFQSIHLILHRVDPEQTAPQNPHELWKKVMLKKDEVYFANITKQNPHLYFNKCPDCDLWMKWDRAKMGGVPLFLACRNCPLEYCSGCRTMHESIDHLKQCIKKFHFPYISDSLLEESVMQKLFVKKNLLQHDSDLNLTKEEGIHFLYMIERAYEHGQSVPCPKCKRRYAKDDKSCTQILKCLGCQSMWCYACGRLAPRSYTELRDFGKNEMVIPQCLPEYYSNNSGARHGTTTPRVGVQYGSIALNLHNGYELQPFHEWRINNASEEKFCPQFFDWIKTDLEEFHKERTIYELHKLLQFCTFEDIIEIIETYKATSGKNDKEYLRHFLDDNKADIIAFTLNV